jgi:hypothetical protein
VYKTAFYSFYLPVALAMHMVSPTLRYKFELTLSVFRAE